MKTEINQLIDRLASKELTFGCSVEVQFGLSPLIKRGRVKLSWWCNDNWCSSNQLIDSEMGEIVKILGHDVQVGDVLKGTYPVISDLQQNELISLWHKCGITKALQDINAEVEWIEDSEECEDHGGLCHCEDVDASYPKDDCIRNLFQLLLQLDL